MEEKNIKQVVKIGIYRIINPTDKSYIGQSIDIERRFKEYKNLRCIQQPKIYNSLKKYGVENHTFKIIEECSLEQLTEREKYWKLYFNSINEGLNCELNDNGVGPRSQEVKEKIRKSKMGTNGRKKGTHHSEYTKSLLSSIAKIQSWRKEVGKKQQGKNKHTDEYRESLKKPIKDLKTNKIYNSCTEAALDLNISLTTLSNSLNKIYKKSKWDFRYE